MPVVRDLVYVLRSRPYFRRHLLSVDLISHRRHPLSLPDLLLIKSTLGVIRSSLANEGPMFMFKGWVPAWTRLQPTTILIFLTFEQLKRIVDWKRGTL